MVFASEKRKTKKQSMNFNYSLSTQLPSPKSFQSTSKLFLTPLAYTQQGTYMNKKIMKKISSIHKK